MQPVFKWPGGKRSLLQQILPLLPHRYDRLIEPFCGGAALFFHLRPPSAILADTNRDLINAYSQLKCDPRNLILKLSQLPNNSDTYYAVRSSKPKTREERAVRFFYLMRLSFNGIYRENLRGDFNVPYGHKSHLPVCDPQHLIKAASILQGTDLKQQGYLETLALATANDLVYVDPPYTVAHNNNGFIKYNQVLFSWRDQVTLAEGCHQAAERGACVVVSNADHRDILELYQGFSYHQLRRFCSISGKTEGRGQVTEAVLTSPHRV